MSDVDLIATEGTCATCRCALVQVRNGGEIVRTYHPASVCMTCAAVLVFEYFPGGPTWTGPDVPHDQFVVDT